MEGDIDLRQTTWRGRNSGKLETSQARIVAHQRTLTLQYVDLDEGLVVDRRREDLRYGDRDGRVAGNQRGEDSALGLNAECQRRHVEEQHIGHLAAHDASLCGGADGNYLVRVDLPVGGTPEELANACLHERHTCHAADEDDLVDFRCLNTGCLERIPTGTERLLNKLFDNALILRARDGANQVEGPLGT